MHKKEKSERVAVAVNNPYDSVKYLAAYPEIISVATTVLNDNIEDLCPIGRMDVFSLNVNIYSGFKGSVYETMMGSSCRFAF